MKRVSQIGFGALALVVGIPVAWRALDHPASVSVEPATAQSVAPRIAVKSPQDTPAPNLALRLSSLLSEQDQRPNRAAPDDLSISQQRDAEFVAQQLMDLLRRDPVQWRNIFDLLDSGDLRLGPRIAAMIREAMDETVERDMIEILRTGSRRESRLLAFSFLEGRSSSTSLSALVASTRQDPDHGVRYMALRELVMRKGQALTPEAAAMIDDAILQRSQVDPSPEVRNAALSALGRPVADDPPPTPMPAPARSFASPAAAQKPATPPQPQEPAPVPPR